MTEFELKFEVSPASLKGVAAAMREGKVTRQHLQASYFDTADGALAARGISVRLRKEGRRWMQTAKGPTADLLERLEHNAAVPPRSGSTLPVLDLARHLGTPIGRAIDKALGRNTADNYPELSLQFGTDIQRITRQIACGASVVEIALDQGRVFSGNHSQTICELEVELKTGAPADAVALARQWCADHRLCMSTISKAMKGQRLRSATAVAADASTNSPKFARHASRQDMFIAAVKSCLCQILPNVSELANGGNHHEHVHQLRVGIRRLRTAMRELGGLANAEEPAWDAVLVQAFRALGAHRDSSYLALVLQPQLLAAGGPDMPTRIDSSDIPDPGYTVRTPEFQDMLIGLVGLVHRQAFEGEKWLKTGKADKGIVAPDGLKKTLSLRLDKLHRRARRQGKKFLTLSEAQQHDVRKRLKRLRYLIEFAAPLFANHDVKTMTTALKPVQDALGRYNDELMALHAQRAAVEASPNAWFGVGWLAARKQSNAKRCLKAIKAFAELKPFWHR